MLQLGFDMRRAKVSAYCPYPAPALVVLVVLLVGSVQFVQCHNVDDYSEFDNPELLPLFTQLGYMTTLLSAEFQKRFNFCVKDPFVSLLLKLLQPWQSGVFGGCKDSGPQIGFHLTIASLLLAMGISLYNIRHHK